MRETRGRTPSVRTASTSARPTASRPTAAISVERAPSRPSQRAVVAADPPWTSATRPGTSVRGFERPRRGQDDVEHRGRRARRSGSGRGGRTCPWSDAGARGVPDVPGVSGARDDGWEASTEDTGATTTMTGLDEDPPNRHRRESAAMTIATDLDRLAIDTIRTLSIDAVQKANSGHPGAPMGAAPMAYVLWTRFLRHAPTHPDWPDRDRFVLSAGHASMLLYSLLHLTGYEVSLEDLQQFRQWGSITPGHPEYGLTPGVEATTGPLGQGFANAVGMAIAERRLAARVQPARPHDRRPLDLRHRLRRRPPGGHRVGGRQPGRPPPAQQARRALRRQPRPARRPDQHGLLRGRHQAVPGLSLAHPARRGRQRPRRHRGRDRGRPSRRHARPSSPSRHISAMAARTSRTARRPTARRSVPRRSG